VIAADIKPAVLENRSFDKAVVIRDGHLLMYDSTGDVAVGDYVCEHINDPASLFSELFCVLKLNGTSFFRTLNKYHYVSCGVLAYIRFCTCSSVPLGSPGCRDGCVLD